MGIKFYFKKIEGTYNTYFDEHTHDNGYTTHCTLYENDSCDMVTLDFNGDRIKDACFTNVSVEQANENLDKISYWFTEWE